MSDPLSRDPLAAVTAAGETVSVPDSHKRVLLEELGPDEVVRAVYHDGWNCAVLTDRGLVLLGGQLSPRATRVPRPLPLLRRASGVLDSVRVLVDGRPHKLFGSSIDPKGALLEAAGELLPPDSPLRPGRRTRTVTWVRRHPVLMSLLVASVVVGRLVSGPDSGSGTQEAVAKDAKNLAETVVPDFRGSALTTAASRAGDEAWLTVSAMDASSGLRPVTTGETGWRVCFQTPSRGETVDPSVSTLTLYAVPEREECPERLYGPRRVVMPDLVGERFDDASRTLDELGLAQVSPFHAHTGKRLDEGEHELSDWRVCRQDPEADSTVTVLEQAGLWLIGSGDPCTEPSPAPEPEPKPKPKPDPDPKPDPKPSYGSTSGGGSTGGSTGGSIGGSTGGTSSSGGSSGGSGSGGSTSGGGGQAGVGFGQFCSPVGATATTADGRPAKCFMGKDGRARWGYNSG
ncbi:hypothetical protein [Streptomyces fungicidicus]|uniref:hypothetical protein n=1 Tax=Streptomyces fungicidicus TaxID=68203 RepID=UPI003323A251